MMVVGLPRFAVGLSLGGGLLGFFAKGGTTSQIRVTITIYQELQSEVAQNFKIGNNAINFATILAAPLYSRLYLRENRH